MPERSKDLIRNSLTTFESEKKEWLVNKKTINEKKNSILKHEKMISTNYQKFESTRLRKATDS